METKNEILPAVSAIIFNERGEVLLQKRRDRNKWCVLSGHVEFGESVEQAIIREIKEETSIASEIVRLVGIYSLPEYQTYHSENRRVQYITAYFEVRLTDLIDIDYSNSETEELKFFKVDAIPPDMDLINPYWLQDALAKNTQPFVR